MKASALQLDGFASDSVRMITTMRKDAQQPVQILLFSATFNEKVKNYALRVVQDNGREQANQVNFLPHCMHTISILQTALSIDEAGRMDWTPECKLCVDRCLCHERTCPWMSSSSTGW